MTDFRIGTGAIFVALVAGVSAARAGQCTSTGTAEYLCTGNFDQGFSVGNVANPKSAKKITVNGIDANIEPTGTSGSAGGTGVFWATGTQSTTLSLLDPTYGIVLDANKYPSLESQNGVKITGAKNVDDFEGGVNLVVGMPVTVHSTQASAIDVVTTADTGADVGQAKVYGPADVITSGASSPGLNVSLTGGDGRYPGGDSGKPGASGGNGGAITVSHDESSSQTGHWSISTSGSTSPAISISGTGGKSSSGAPNSFGTGGASGPSSGTGAAILVGSGTVASPGLPARLQLSTSGSSSPALAALSRGGDSGSGGTSSVTGGGGNSEPSGHGGHIVLRLEDSSFTTNGASSVGVLAVSQGGNGGKGGGGSTGSGGHGGVGSGGGQIDITLLGANTVNTKESESDGVAGYSIGGVGGEGGDGGWAGAGGSGGATGNSGNVTIDTTASAATTIKTFGDGSYGVVAQSIAGHGGGSGTGVGLVQFAAQAGSAGKGGNVTIKNAADVTTSGNVAVGLSAQSIGGGGGHGGSSFGAFYSAGGSGGQGGDGTTVVVENTGAVTTTGNSSSGISAQSIGGSGGSGGSSGGLYAIGGNAAGASKGGAVTVTNSGDIMTGVGTPSGDADAADGCTQGCSHGIFAQSLGGGGGNGGSSGGWFAFGGAGGGGGGGGTATATSTGATVSTTQIHSPGILVQSIGGGGGHGGASAAGGEELSAAVGGLGGDGGSGDTATLNATSGSTISTEGDFSHGLIAQSVGGGGGAGGFAVDVAVGEGTPSVSLAVGGQGGKGGGAGAAVLNTVDSSYSGSTANTVSTKGDHAGGLVAQSIGGGGGHGGLAVSASISNVSSLAIGIGGSGGGGGKGLQATVTSDAGISTEGDHSDGILVQSIGGGGGHGGTSVSLSLSTVAALSVGVGGAGGVGGQGDSVQLTSSGGLPISTLGDFSYGALAQSIGGGGGKGGTSIAGSLAFNTSDEGSAALAFGFGGTGGSGGAGDSAAISIDNPVTTKGDHSGGIVAQSIGGGGGSGGTAVAASITSSDSGGLAFSLGGNGGKGSNSGGASNVGSGDVTTTGDHAPGVVAQAIAGGGGNGGMAVSGTLSLSGSKSLSLTVGGVGGSGGNAGPATSNRTGAISTAGQLSDAVVAQSLGGGGGNGGMAVDGNITTSNSTSIAVGVGGDGNGGGTGAETSVDVVGDISATGEGSRGILAQSIGGGGGSGGMSIAANLTSSSTTKELGVTIGGGGGSGEFGGSVTVNHTGDITTGSAATADPTMPGGEHGILAQSVGGGGGSGGLAASGTTNRGNRSLNVNVGGGSGTGGFASKTSVTQGGGTITTHGPASHGIVAQSIGGGGGNGGSTTSFSISNDDAKDISVTLGGKGGSGGYAQQVTLANDADITVGGLGSQGLVAQSIGGGGGNGGSNSFLNQKGKAATAGQLTVGVGGKGGNGADGGIVALTNAGAITTGTAGDNGDDAAGNATPGYGILAQSIGGSGGNGGVGIRGDVDTTQGATVGVGGSGKGGGIAAMVTVTGKPKASVTTRDDGAHGIVAQSISGGGGNGATGIDGDVSNSGSDALTLGLGNTGGDAGAAGGVVVDSPGSIFTHGDGAKGILAQSIAGGGGTGGIGISGKVTGSSKNNTNQLVVGVGFSGAAGGTGGPVTITNIDEIQTGLSADGGVAATGMDAIFAQSVGGGGGSASAGISGGFTAASEAKALEFGIGGTGGSGATGGTVTVKNDGDLSTLGSGSRGIFAQSIGGGGGNGGAGILGDVSTGKDGSQTTQIEVGIGLPAGSAGPGGKVDVTNTGDIATQAIDGQTAREMHAIFAQSVGGGGGSGSVGIGGDVTNASKSKSLDVGIGGGSGTGGDGGAVSVGAQGDLSVVGDGSRGIYAQSVGGGGGSGGIGVKGSVSGAKDATDVSQLGVSVGGSGGSGGNGGDLTVTQSGTIATAQAASTDAQMHGIFAQSVGGGGGDGGIGVDGDVTGAKGSKALTVAIGGTGKGGGGGGTVEVSAQGAITTLGDGSAGIFAQSIGGGGGTGGAGLNGTVTGGGSNSGADPGDSDAGKTLTFAIGNSGGSGGKGGNVTVSSSGTIVTGSGSGDDLSVSGSHGILAQSVGAGGGVGALTGSLLYGGSASGKGIAMSVGASPLGGDGGTVKATNTGRIVTTNFASHGVFAQSVGGSGGSAGDLGGMGAVDTWSAAVIVGAAGGSGNGGGVTITNGTTAGTGGAVTTAGDGAFALYAQSIGGGGGDGGNAAGLINSSDSSASTKNADVVLNLGASNAVKGKGGTVVIDHQSGALLTQGASATAVFAQSVGGGGGTAGTGAAAASGTVNIGGTGSTIGNGGPVTVTLSGGSVEAGRGATPTGGVVSALGVLAQSVGGGGGVAGNISFDGGRFGTGLAMNDAGNATTGDGDKVTVTVDAPVTTHGASSVGVLAQSVGGGGGIKGDAATTTGRALIGSGGGVGDAGDVAVSVGADITTTGANAHGVVAQSAAGKAGGSATGAPGSVTVEVTGGTIDVSGADADGIFVQAAGAAAGSGTLAVTVDAGGAVKGGSGAGAAVKISGGASRSRSLTNHGTITGRPLAIQGTMNTLDNYGTLGGNLNIAGLTQAVTNHEGGTLNIGQTASLGASDTSSATLLSNSGTLAPGGASTYTTARLTNPHAAADVFANYTQTSTGSYAVDVLSFQNNGARGKSDLFSLDGAADMAGTVDVTFDTGNDPGFGPGTATIVTADSGVSAATQGNLTVVPSMVAQYQLQYPDSKTIELSYHVDFANDDALGATRGNQDELSESLQGMWEAGTFDRAAANRLIAISDPDAYRDAADSLSGEIYAVQKLATLHASMRFSDAMMSCAERGGGYRFIREGQCGWLSLSGSRLDQDANDISRGFTSTSRTIAGGLQFDTGNDWRIGAAFSWEDRSTDIDALANSDGDQFMVGVVAKKQFGPALLAASLAAGPGSFDTTRNLVFGSTARGDQDLRLVAARLRGEYLIERGSWYFKPRLEFGVDHISSSSFTETGAGGFSHQVAGGSDTWYNVRPAIEVGGEIAAGNGMLLRPVFGLGVTRFFGSDAPMVGTQFTGAPGGQPGFSSAASFDRSWIDVEVGFDLLKGDDFVFSVKGFGIFADNSRDEGVQVKLSYAF